MNVAIVGSRTYNDYEHLKSFINRWKTHFNISIDYIISGGANGADKLAERYADEHAIQTKIFKPDWNKYGKSAGFRRNIDIIKNCDVCFAFWDGESHGTKHDIDLCIQFNKICYVYNQKLNKEYEARKTQ